MEVCVNSGAARLTRSAVGMTSARIVHAIKQRVIVRTRQYRSLVRQPRRMIVACILNRWLVAEIARVACAVRQVTLVRMTSVACRVRRGVVMARCSDRTAEASMRNVKECRPCRLVSVMRLRVSSIVTAATPGASRIVSVSSRPRSRSAVIRLYSRRMIMVSWSSVTLRIRRTAIVGSIALWNVR